MFLMRCSVVLILSKVTFEDINGKGGISNVISTLVLEWVTV